MIVCSVSWSLQYLVFSGSRTDVCSIFSLSNTFFFLEILGSFVAFGEVVFSEWK